MRKILKIPSFEYMKHYSIKTYRKIVSKVDKKSIMDVLDLTPEMKNKYMMQEILF